jgi:sulfite reductase (ferredoxin)
MVEQFRLSVRLTPQQSLILNGIHDADRTAIETLIHDYGIKTVEQFSNLRRYGLACVALPTCGLAITEAERVFPSVISEFEQVLTEIGLPNESISMRITGCPNGCARPYVAEIAFVGRSLDKYTIFLGGSAVGTRLALPFMDLVPLDQLTTVLRPVLRAFGETRLDGEAFGDFVHRVGIPSLRILVSSYESAAD